MKNSIKAGILLALLIGFILGLVKVYMDIPGLDEQVTHLNIDKNDNLYVALNTGMAEQIIKLDNNQRIIYTHSLKKLQHDSIRKIEDLKVDSAGNIYLLVTSKNMQTQLLSQKLIALNTKSITGGEKVLADLKSGSIFYQYLDISSQDISSGVQMLGYDSESQKIVQDKMLFTPDKQIKFSRENIASFDYPKKLGIYKFFKAGNLLGCISMAGEVYQAKEGKAAKLEAKGINEPEQAVSFITADSKNNVYVGEQKSGNFLQLDLARKTAYLRNRASETITKSSQLTYKDIYQFAMNDEDHFAVAAKNNNMTQIVSISQDKSIIYNKFSIGFDNVLRLEVKYFILYFFTLSLLLVAGLIIVFWIGRSKRVLYKLVFVTVPVVSIILAGLGFIIYNIYSKEITAVYLNSTEDSARLTEKQLDRNTIESLKDHTRFKSPEYNVLESRINQLNTANRLLAVEDKDIYILVDKGNPYLYKLDGFIKFKNRSLYERAIETKTMQQGIVTDVWGNHLSSIIPVLRNDKVIALLETSMFQGLISEKTKVFSLRLTVLILLITLLILVCLIFIFRKVLMPLKEIEKILKNLKENKILSKIPYRSRDEFFTISQTINNMTEDIQVQIYNLSNLSEKYFRFVPKKLFFLFNKNNISDLELGDMAKLNAAIAVTAVQYTKEKAFWERKILDQTNRNFTIINEKIDTYDGILAGSNRQLSELTAIYPDSFDKALEASLVITDQLRAVNKEEAHSFLTLLDKAEIDLGIGGNESRLSVVILSKRMEKLYENLEMLKHTGCKIILTEEAYKKIVNTDVYEFRYIGYIRQDENFKINLYDFYQADSEEIRKAKRDTKELFKEALNSFYERDFYKAKNLFSLVLRSNKEDEIARWYVFRSAHLYEYGTPKDDLNIVPYLKNNY